MFGSVADGMAETGADVSVLFVPPAFTKAAVVEAIDAQIGLAVVITEGVPVHDTAAFFQLRARTRARRRLIGPNCPGLISPGKSNAGIIPADITQGRQDRPGVEVGHADLPDDVRAARHRLLDRGRHRRRPRHRHDAHRLPRGVRERPRDRGHRHDRRDRRRRRGACGGVHQGQRKKPVVGYVAGFTAPEGKTMGHAGAIVSGSSGTAAAKQEALEAVGVRVGKTPSETANLMRELVG